MFLQNPCVGIFWDELEKVIRIEKRMSLREFCQKADISPGTLQNLRAREAPDDLQPFTVRRIAAAFDWSVADFNAWWDKVSGIKPLDPFAQFQKDLEAEAAERGIEVAALIAEIQNKRRYNRVPNIPGTKRADQLIKGAADSRVEDAKRRRKGKGSNE